MPGKHGPSEKQVRYVMYLLKQAGFSTRYMDKDFKRLGATMRERSGPVVEWVENMDRWRVSELIDDLKSMSSATAVALADAAYAIEAVMEELDVDYDDYDD